MESKKGKFYYENVLASQNMTALNNVVWVADTSKLELYQGKKAHIFICIDIHTNLIVASCISKNKLNSGPIVKHLESAIKTRINDLNDEKLIIHVDRGSEFSSKVFNNFVNKYSELFVPSMSRLNTPTDNAVMERFWRTLKNHRIYGTTIEEDLTNSLATIPNFSGYRACLNKYAKSINSTPSKKATYEPQKVDKSTSGAALLIHKPNFFKAQSQHVAEDPRLHDVENYKAENKKVVTVLKEIAAKKAELVEQTPFDNYEDKLILEVIDNKLEEIYAIIQSDSQMTREYVSQSIEPVENSLDKLHEKVDKLLTKNRKNREVLPLRDPIDRNLFPIFFTNAGSQCKRQPDLKQAQLRVAYTILYHTGLRVNEIRSLTEEQISRASKTSQISVIHHKTKQPYIHVLSKQAVLNLNRLQPEINIIFNKYKFNYLFGKQKLAHKKAVIRFINRDLENTCKINAIPFNIKSHSFRINMISSLLKTTSVQNAAQLIGHKDIKSTMSYQKYALSKDEIQELLERVENQNN